MPCEICGSDKFVDAHHYDCKEGKISPETINLCRRCHRTYHDRGIDWFDDEKLDKVIEMENKARTITGLGRKIKRDDIQRSDYWNKIHGLKRIRKQPSETVNAKQLGFITIDELMRLK